MNIKQAAELLTDEGINIICSEDGIRKETVQEEGYIELRREDVWVLNKVQCERRSIPEYHCLGKFNTEEQGAKFFVLNQLNSIYLYKYIAPVKDSKEFFSRINNMDIIFLEETMKKCGIPLTYVSYLDKKSNSIYIHEKVNGWHTSFVNKDLQICATSVVPTSKEKCIARAFNHIYRLFLLDELIKRNLNKGISKDTFNDIEIMYYLGYKDLEDSLKEIL